MYAIKGGWVGQTFALATCNESGGRKARIRRSKEERKAMVESFIKRYQSLNEGKFPSLNLTHKEVGGSFYTVREIVRDIIQENRVLGPAKYSSEKQKFDVNSRGFPVESALVESQDTLFKLAIENPAVSDQQVSSNVELNVHGNEQCANHEFLDAGQFVGKDATKESEELVCADSSLTESFEDNKESGLVGASIDHQGNRSTELNLHDNGHLGKHEDLGVEQFVNGSQTGELDKVVCTRFSDNEQRNKDEDLDVQKFVEGSQVEESDKLVCGEPSLSEKYEVNRKSELIEASAANFANLTEDIVVETFPLRSVIKDIYTLDMGLNNSTGMNGELEKLESKRLLESGNGSAVNSSEKLDRMNESVNASESVDQKALNGPEVPSSDGGPAIAHETAANYANKLLEAEDLSKSGETDHIYTQDQNKPVIIPHNGLASLETIGESQEMTGAKARDDQDTICTNILNGAKVSSGKMQLTSEKPVILASANDVHREDQALKETKPTLDRINLESWEGASKKSSDQETNPLLAFVKAFVSAFVKFFSE